MSLPVSWKGKRLLEPLTAMILIAVAAIQAADIDHNEVKRVALSALPMHLDMIRSTSNFLSDIPQMYTKKEWSVEEYIHKIGECLMAKFGAKWFQARIEHIYPGE